jgi:hypothetical protein
MFLRQINQQSSKLITVSIAGKAFLLIPGQPQNKY